MKHPFTDEQLLEIFEAARIALSDGEIYDHIAEIMDASDLTEVRDRLESYMNNSETFEKHPKMALFFSEKNVD
jgi:hypothetical protein